MRHGGSTSSSRPSSRTTAGAASPTFCCAKPDGTYEALDRKLARTAKPAYILQLLFYSEQLARIQGRAPGGSTCCSAPASRRRSTREEFAAHYRRVRARLERFVGDPPPTEPLAC